MVWDTSPRHLFDTLASPAWRSWLGAALLLGVLILLPLTLPGMGGEVSKRPVGPQDPCQPLIQQTTKHLREILASRLVRGFPMTAQLDEGNARLSPMSLLLVDCAERRVVVSGSYEFRGNLGVMDITRRGTTVLQFSMSPKPSQHQVWLETPEILDVTFDNPAPWFDGKAIRNWVLSLFAEPVCTHLQNGQPC
jgi:hypothetical protein